MHAACSGETAVVGYLVSIGVNVNQVESTGPEQGGQRRTALHLGCFIDNVGIAEVLIKHGADVNLGDVNNKVSYSIFLDASSNQTACSFVDSP